MNNWKLVKEEIEKEFDKILANDESDSMAELRARAINVVVARHSYTEPITLFDSIDWLTQEAKPKCLKIYGLNTDQAHHICCECAASFTDSHDGRLRCSVLNCDIEEYLRKAEPQTIKEKVEKIAEKKDLFPTLSAEEKAYNIGYTDGFSAWYKKTHACKFYGNNCDQKCDGLDEFCEIRKEYEPQQKAKFIKTKHPKGTEATPLKRYINVSNNMPNITCIDEDSYFGTAIISGNEIGFIEKPTDEVIQQLGIEVV